MTSKDNQKSVSSIYAWGFPINLTLELLIQFISLLLPVTLVLKSLESTSVLRVTLSILAAIYIYPLTILFLGSIITRILPKPPLGYLKTSEHKFKYQTLIALNTFIRRTPARWLLNIPFPGILFQQICGARIASSSLITFSDTLPDPYLISIGKNSLLGWGCLVLGHYAPNPSTLFLGRVEIGDNVIIGAEAMVWPNVKIGDGSIIQNKSVVMPGTIIPAEEIWGGVPAQKIKSIKDKRNSTVNPSVNLDVNLDVVENYIKSFLADNYKVKNFNSNNPLLSLDLSAYEITRLLNNLEREFGIFIDRTGINIEEFSFDNLIQIINKTFPS